MADSFFAELSEWKTMIQKGLTTFVEVPLEWGEEDQRSECHPWSTSPDIYFFKTVCGIRPVSPGYKTVVIEPTLGKLKTLNAIFPHPLGKIEMSLATDNGHLSGDITIPQGMNATFIWKGKEQQLTPGKQHIKL